eukprot:s678_g19.t1
MTFTNHWISPTTPCFAMDEGLWSGKRSAKLLLAQQKASAADLERRLQAAQARLANQPSQPSQVQPDYRELAEALRLSEQEAAEAAGERDMLHNKLQRPRPFSRVKRL